MFSQVMNYAVKNAAGKKKRMMMILLVWGFFERGYAASRCYMYSSVVIDHNCGVIVIVKSSK